MKKKNGRKVTEMWCDVCRYSVDHEFQGIGQGWICTECNKHSRVGQSVKCDEQHIKRLGK